MRLVLLLTFFLLTSCTNRTGAPSFAPGDLAPDFSIPYLGGGTKKLSDYRGKVVLLNFRASWCGPCVAELPALERLQSKLKDRGFIVVSIGIDDDEDSLSTFAERFGLSFPVLVDRLGEVKGRYRLTGVPETFILDRDGRFVMVMDPADNSPVVRIIGPREWDTPNSVSRLAGLLG